MKKQIQSCLEAIDYRIRHARFDKTFKAKIIENLGKGRYKIQHKKLYYTVSSKTPFQAGDIVRVCAPENNYNDLFIQTCGCSEVCKIKPAIVTRQVGSLKDFVEITAVGPTYMGMARIKDTGGWTPAGANIWVRIIYTYQNTYNNSGRYPVEGMLLITWGQNLRVGYVSGCNGDYTVTWNTL